MVTVTVRRTLLMNLSLQQGPPVPGVLHATAMKVEDASTAVSPQADTEARLRHGKANDPQVTSGKDHLVLS